NSRRAPRSLPDAEPREHLVEHALADFNAAQLCKRAYGVAELDRNDLRWPSRAACCQCGAEAVARGTGECCLPRGRDERLLAAFLIGDPGDGQHAGAQIVEALTGGSRRRKSVARIAAQVRLAAYDDAAFAVARTIVPRRVTVVDDHDDVGRGDPRL